MQTCNKMKFYWFCWWKESVDRQTTNSTSRPLNDKRRKCQEIQMPKEIQKVQSESVFMPARLAFQLCHPL